MRTLEPPNRVRIGLMGILVTAARHRRRAEHHQRARCSTAKPEYYGQFTDTGGLSTGDKVRIAGVDVGKVESLKIDGDHILVKFNIGTQKIGTESRLAIKTDTILGKKVLEDRGRGATSSCAPATPCRSARAPRPTRSTTRSSTSPRPPPGWDIDTVKQSLHVLSETVDQTYPHLSAALDGVAKFSDTIGKRDEQIKHLLAQANQVASVLGDRSEQVDRLLVNAKTLLAAFNERGRAIDALLSNVAAFSEQVKGLDQRQPEPQPRAGAVAHHQRHPGPAQGRPRRRDSPRSASSSRR